MFVPYSASPVLCQRSVGLGGVGDSELEREGEQQRTPENFTGLGLENVAHTDGHPVIT